MAQDPKKQALGSWTTAHGWETRRYYKVSFGSSTIAANIGSNQPVLSFRWSSSTETAVIHHLEISLNTVAAMSAAYNQLTKLYIARSFSASDSGGTAVTPAAGKQMLSVDYGNSAAGDVRHSSTGALTAGTRTLDTQPMWQRYFPMPATAAALVESNVAIYNWREDGHGIHLSQNEGIVLVTSNADASGTWQLQGSIVWSEG